MYMISDCNHQQIKLIMLKHLVKLLANMFWSIINDILDKLFKSVFTTERESIYQ